MKRVFIINPKSGSGQAIKIQALAEAKCLELGIEASFIRTRCPGHAESIARQLAEQTDPAEGLRIYVCGGDGTLNEVINGIVGNYWVEVGCLPCGSGNDLARVFGSLSDMLDLEAQLAAKPREIVFLNYRLYGKNIKDNRTRKAVNFINSGFDGNVVKKMGDIKAKFKRGGAWTYYLAVFINLIEKKGAKLKVWRDGELVHDGKLLLMAAGKGQYYGGGVRALPGSELDQEAIDNVFVKNVSRFNFLRLFSKYKNGSYIHVDRPDLYDYAKSKRIEYESKGHDFIVAVDGELSKAHRVEIWLAEEKLRFLCPEA